jgi:hypothetical protein
MVSSTYGIASEAKAYDEEIVMSALQYLFDLPNCLFCLVRVNIQARAFIACRFSFFDIL